MMSMGDEFARTQRGNNNPYNLDDPDVTHVDWTMADGNSDLVGWWRALIAFRKAHRSIGRATFWRDDVTFFGSHGAVDTNPWSRSFGWRLDGARCRDDDIAVITNMWVDPVTFPVPDGDGWRLVFDTALTTVAPEAGLEASTITVAPRSIVVLRRSAPDS
jgi:isoamylase